MLAILLAILPSVVAIILLVGMVVRGAKMVAVQLEATQDNTKAIQVLTTRLLAVERLNIETNVIAVDIQDKQEKNGK